MSAAPPESCSCAALRQAARHITRLYDEALAPAGVGLNQFSILSKLDRLGEGTIQALAAVLVMDRSTLGHLLRPLERRSLVTVRASAQDGRKKIVALTAEGRAVLAAARPLWQDAEARFETAFGPERAAGMRATMRQVTTVDFTE